jgi:S-adenosyl-L-methionine hydrolase (adenosine-forming)
MSKSKPIITLTTDFGLNDPFVGILKGVISGIAPDATIIDITHGISSHDVVEAALALRASHHFFPAGTIHVIIVDPGVGTSRRPLLLVTEKYFFVGPDNGLLWPNFQSAKEKTVIHLTRDDYFLKPVSHTFHGRDIFAPVAAWLSKGVEPQQMGEIVDSPMVLELPEVRKIGVRKVIGTILSIDKFGNLITNLLPEDLPPTEGESTPYVFHIGSHHITQLRRAYAGAPAGELFAIWGSTGHLEISVNQASAAALLGVKKSQEFDVELTTISPATLSGIMEW